MTFTLASARQPNPWDYPEALDGGGFWYPRIDHGYSARRDEEAYTGPVSGPLGWSTPVADSRSVTEGPVTSETDAFWNALADVIRPERTAAELDGCRCGVPYGCDCRPERDPVDGDWFGQDEERSSAPARVQVNPASVLTLDAQGELCLGDQPVAVRHASIARSIVPETSDPVRAHHRGLGDYHVATGTFYPARYALVMVDE